MKFKRMIIHLFLILIFIGCGCTLLSADAGTKEMDIMERYNSILKLIGKKEYDQAIIRLKEMIKSSPGFHRAYEKLVEVYRWKRDIDGALSFLEDIIEKTAENPYAYYAFGDALIRKKQYDQAITNYKKSITLKSDFPSAYSRLVYSYLKGKKDRKKAQQEVENYFKVLIKKNSTSACAYYGLGYLYYAQRKWEKALSMLNKAIDLEPSLLRPYETKGRIHFYTGNLREALKVWLLELELIYKTKDLELQGKVLGNIGLIYDDLSDYKNSLIYHKRAFEIIREVGNKKDIGKVLGNIGVVYGNLGDFEKTLEYNLKALSIMREIGDQKNEGSVLGNIGVSYEQLGDNSKALTYFEKALVIHKKIGNKRSEGIVTANIGGVYRNFGCYEKALTHYKDALAIDRNIGDKRNEGIDLGNIGVVYCDLADYKKALEFYEKALSIHREVGNKSSEGLVLASIGNFYIDVGQFKKALEYHKKGLTIHREIGDKRTEGFTLNSCGTTYLALKEYDKSEKHYRQALKIGKRIKAPEIIWAALAGLGTLYRAEGKYEIAFSYYKKSIQTIESVRGKLKIEEQKSGFMGDKIKIYEDIVSLLFEMHQKGPLKGYHELAFNYAERSRSRAFLDMLAESRANIKEGIDPELLKREKILNREFSLTQSALQEERVKPEEKMNQKRVRELEEKLKNFDEEFEHLKLQMARKNPKYATLKYPVPTTLQELQQKILDKDTVMFEYMVGEKSSYLWKVSRDSFEARKLDIGREEMERRVKLLRHLIETSSNAPGFAAQSYILYQKLMEPAIGMVPKGKKLLIVPDGILNYLPFEVLCTKKVGKRDGKYLFKTLHYLIKKYPVYYVQSASVWASLQQEPAPLNLKKGKGTRKLLAFGDPVFIGEKELSGNAFIRSAFRGSEPVQFNRLIYSGKEVEAISKLFRPSDIYLRELAKEEKMKQLKDLSQYRYIHFATHGILNENKPQFSGLVLTQDDDPTEDGFLQMREILNLKLNADLVVLSACRTGLGKLVRGEGIIGLTRAWMYAGTPSVMVSLWAVNDASTAKLMEMFYKYLKKGMDKTNALRKAKLRLLKKTGAVRGWAGFVLMGE
jgi:CHAT domain-containing protein/Tfp pilus assembly protein PilF